MAEIDRIAGVGPYKMAGSAWAEEAMGRLRATGLKSVLAGEISVPSPVEVAPSDVPRRLLDLIPKTSHSSNDFSFLRQTVKDNRADVVPDYGAKPVSTLHLLLRSQIAAASSPIFLSRCRFDISAIMPR